MSQFEYRLDADVRLEPAQALEQFPVHHAMPMKPVSRTPWSVDEPGATF
jgi:hypothetical protein